MIKLIVNADDFGLNEGVNNAILQSFSLGYITNTTLMVNMPGTDDAVKRAKEYGVWEKVGLHINLFEGIPLNPNLCNFPELFDSNLAGGGI